MIFKVLTLFPEMIESVMNTGIIGRALKEGKIGLKTYNIRDYADNNRAQVDDYPYGGGAGQVIMAEPVYRCYQAAVYDSYSVKRRCVYLSPTGKKFDQRMAKEFSHEDEIIFLCGHYEGVDQRVLDEIVTDYVSAGDYILTGGELPALTMIDAVSRLLPGVLGNDSSPDIETFYRDLLEYPQYSRPEIWRGKNVPSVLLSGSHANIEKHRLAESIVRTRDSRPDLYEKYERKTGLIDKMKRARIQNIPASQALLFSDSEILFESDELYLVKDYDNRSVFAGCFEKKGISNSVKDTGEFTDLLSLCKSEGYEVYLLNLPETFAGEDLENLVMITFTERNPLSSARVRDHGKTGQYLREKISGCLSAGRTYYEFIPFSDDLMLSTAVSIGLYSSPVIKLKK